MRNLGLIVPYDYKLLSIAAILDVFETVNRIYSEENREKPFDIKIFRAPDQIEKEGAFLHGYPVTSIKSELKADVVLIPSFSTENMKETLTKNQMYIPWLHRQFQDGAEIASFCTGTFLFGASGLLNGKLATTHIDACTRFSLAFPAVILKPDHIVTDDGCFYTSGGSTSTFHLLLRLVQKYCGNEMVIRIAKILPLIWIGIARVILELLCPVATTKMIW